MRLELAGMPWAIQPDALRDLARANYDGLPDLDRLRAQLGSGEGLYAQPLRPGRRLEGTRSVSERDGVGILRVAGPIFPRANFITDFLGLPTLDGLAQDLERARTAVRALALYIDSPGGVGMGLDGLTRQVEDVASQMPTMSFVGGMATSAGYWLAAAAGEIAAYETAVLGSIGVIANVERQEAPDSEGVVGYEIVSSGAPNKRPDPTTAEGADQIRSLADSTEDIFVEAVARLRGVTAERVRDPEGFGAGGMVSGREALARGMIDRLDSFENSLARLAARAGLTAAVA